MFTIVWLYLVKPEYVDSFEKAYVSNGDWAQFFGSGEGYLGTQFYKSSQSNHQYMTIDTWVSEEAYNTFGTERQEEYQRLDNRFEVFTVSETRIGSFDLIQR